MTAFAAEASALTKALSQLPKHAGRFTSSHLELNLMPQLSPPHVVVCCDRIDATTLFHLLETLLSDDNFVPHGAYRTTLRMEVVLLSPTAPTYELEVRGLITTHNGTRHAM